MSMRKKSMQLSALIAVVATVLSAALVQPASAASLAEIDVGTASSECSAFFNVPSGPEPLSSCQWDMRIINATAAHAKATGRGVKVGVIDSGVDITHPDVAPNLDLGLSCSFINSTTPTADPKEIANGDCNNKAAVQD